MEATIHEVIPELRAVLHSAWSFRIAGDVDREQWLPPHGFSELIFFFGDQFCLKVPDRGIERLTPVLAVDIHDHALRVLAPHECLVCGLQFLPGSYADFRRAYQAERSNGSTSNTEWHRVTRLQRWPSLVSRKGDPADSLMAYLQRQLLELLRDSGIHNGTLRKRGLPAVNVNGLAMELLASSDHSEPIAETVGSAAHASLRVTEQHFRRRTGLTIKRYQRIARFKHTMKLLFDGGDKPALCDLAIKLGYSDQAHMAREVRAFSEWTPTEIRSGRNRGSFEIYRFMLQMT